MAPSSFLSSLTKPRTSLKLLYIGAGAMRITCGLRTSQMTPCADTASWTFTTSSRNTNESWAPRLSGSRGVMISTFPASSVSTRLSKYAVSFTDLPRSLSIVASLNVSVLARSAAMHNTDGLDIMKLWAPGDGMKRCSISKRSSFRWPHQPARRVKVWSSLYRSWTNAPAMLPGPEFKYLYVHQHAKSQPQSWSWRRMLPTAWARSKPTLQPASCPAFVMAAMSKHWPV
mmetsp:Transcript_32272/g.89114  ORF Transcript_32272/g.89114 Transcript_32272/m.89114 type:complete len:229 (-) Transcript_32272:746-1432(-)